MTMSRALLMAAVAMLVMGCNQPKPTDLVKMAFDPGSTPDERREGINGLSTKSWGLGDKYLKGYSTVLTLDQDPLVRAAAVRALGRSGNAKYLPDVLAALEDDSLPVRRDAAVALDNVVGDAAIEPLRRHALEDKDVQVRASCATAMRHYGRTEVVRALMQCLYDDQFAVRYQAHRSLVAMTRQDVGYDPAAWAKLEHLQPASQPTDASGRPWWDWMGTTK